MHTEIVYKAPFPVPNKGNDIHWAIKRLLEGRKVRRSSWYEKGAYLTIENLEIVLKGSSFNGEDSEAFSLTQCEIEATNWEIFRDTVTIMDLGEKDFVYVVRNAGTLDGKSEVAFPKKGESTNAAF